MSEPKRYTIEHINDILEIPEEKIDHFLEDLRGWYTHAKAWKDMLGVISEIAGDDAATTETKFVWIDDDKHDAKVTIQIRTPEGEQE